MDPRPIGVFDSGVGGLTVLKELVKVLPAEDFIYLGDTARYPYGSQSREVVARLAREITSYLVECGVKAVVVACNTATASAMPQLAQEFAVPVMGVIDAGVKRAVAASRIGAIGVIGTYVTMASGAYQQALWRSGAKQVWARACPLFVPLVEEGLVSGEMARLAVAHHLGQREPVDALILGCTHYPLLKGAIGEFLGPQVTLIDSAESVAALAPEELRLDPAPRREGRVQLQVTGEDRQFRAMLDLIGGIGGPVERVRIERLQEAYARRARQG
ncbi:MAG: glutamate racemase [Deinococcus sp.]|nr:glutamate racemase [Deinococcus sp.]